MKRLSLSVASACALALVASSVAATFGWRVIGHASASGQFAVAAANGSANHPHSIAVRVTGGGGGVQGLGVVACSRGIASIGSTSTNYHGHFALLKMPMKNSDNCQVTASASGSGHLTLQILAK